MERTPMPATQVSCDAWLGDKRWKGRGLKLCAAGLCCWLEQVC